MAGGGGKEGCEEPRLCRDASEKGELEGGCREKDNNQIDGLGK